MRGWDFSDRWADNPFEEEAVAARERMEDAGFRLRAATEAGDQAAAVEARRAHAAARRAWIAAGGRRNSR